MKNSSWKTWSLDKLEDAIIVLDKLFYEGQDTIYDGQVISNTQYDLMRYKLEHNRANSRALAKVTNSEITGTTFKHSPPFCSLTKINRESEKDKYADLVDWLNKRQENIGWDNFSLDDNECGVLPMFCQAYKLDGIALRLYYENGKLIRAGLRPNDGINGEDVTENAKYISGIPQTLSKPYTLSVSGEVICLISDFKEINNKLAENNEKLRANPRNHAAGSIRLFKNPKKTAEGKLRFIGYSIENFVGNPPYKDEIERAKWCNQKLGIPFVQIRPFRVQDLAKMEENVKNLNYEVDGVVISVRNLEEQEQCGKHGESVTANPKGKIAWKFKEKHADIKVEKIIWQVGRTGRIVPVLAFEGVPLAGTTVSRATAHNYGFLKRNEIGIGTIVRIIKSGKIIPKVIDVIGAQKKAVAPQNCPCCEFPTSIICGSEDNIDVFCNNDKCPAKNVQRMLHYLKTVGVKGIGDATVTELIDRGVITELHHFYQLKENDFEYTDLSERQALLALADIHMIPNPSKIKDNSELKKLINKAVKNWKNIKAGKFLAALGIPNVAEVTGDTLINHFKTIEKVMKASYEQLSQIQDIGEKTAESLCEFFANNSTQIKELLKYVKLELPKQGKLNGKIFVLSGTLPNSKEYWKSRIEDLGGIVKSSVGSSTDFLVAGEGSGTKSEKATKLGIPIIDTKKLEKFLT